MSLNLVLFLSIVLFILVYITFFHFFFLFIFLRLRTRFWFRLFLFLLRRRRARAVAVVAVPSPHLQHILLSSSTFIAFSALRWFIAGLIPTLRYPHPHHSPPDAFVRISLFYALPCLRRFFFLLVLHRIPSLPRFSIPFITTTRLTFLHLVCFFLFFHSAPTYRFGWLVLWFRGSAFRIPFSARVSSGRTFAAALPR